ncbi:MAG: hypothetical protein BGP22_10270 [Variovorax sp. 67-131]|nr:MAG: hypothetical protein BGP22_10270 [Variovorax sp. 67-131]
MAAHPAGVRRCKCHGRALSRRVAAEIRDGSFSKGDADVANLPPNAFQLLNVMFGELSIAFGQVCNYWLGSSAGSKRAGDSVAQDCRAGLEIDRGGADKNLDWFHAANPRLTRYSMGLREPREILIRFSLYQRMYESTASMNCSMVVFFQSRG